MAFWLAHCLPLELVLGLRFAMCLWEGGEPYEIESRTLETLGKVDVIYGGRDPSASGGGLKADVWDVAAAMLKPILYGTYIRMK